MEGNGRAKEKKEKKVDDKKKIETGYDYEEDWEFIDESSLASALGIMATRGVIRGHKL